MGQPATSRVRGSLQDFWAFYRHYTKTAAHAAAAAGLAIFGLLVFLDPWFAALAIVSYVAPPVVLYLLADDQSRDAAIASERSERSTDRDQGRGRKRNQTHRPDSSHDRTETTDAETALFRPTAGGSSSTAADRAHGSDPDGDGDTDTDRDWSENGDTDTDTDSDWSENGDTDTDSDSGDGDGDSDTDSDTDDGDSDTDTDSDSDTDSDRDS